MEEHILEDITYADAAKSVHMSAYSFHRVFSLFEPLVIIIAIGGVNVMEYRIEHQERRFLAVRRAFSTETSLDETGTAFRIFGRSARRTP